MKPLKNAPDEPVLTAYQEGYVANTGTDNPHKWGTAKRGDWNIGYMDRRAGRPPQTGGHYGKPLSAATLASNGVTSD